MPLNYLTMRLKGLFIIEKQWKTFQNLTLEDETPNYGPRLGKLVHQLPGVVTLAYDLRLTRMIARWKDLSEEYDEKDDFFHKIIGGARFPKKTSFMASKWLRKFRTRKTAKNSKLRYN